MEAFSHRDGVPLQIQGVVRFIEDDEYEPERQIKQGEEDVNE
jgi:hypothetical protein